MNKNTESKILHPRLLKKYQLRAFNKIIDNENFGLFLEMGLGKTITTLSAIQYLKFTEIAVSRVLIIAPLTVCKMVWRQEAAKWQHTRRLKFSLVTGTEKARVNALEQKADIYLINIDNIAWLTGYYGASWPFDMLVIDESSKIKNPSSRRFKALKVIRPLAGRVVLLTGTPRTQGIQDIWSQIYMLDGGERLGGTITTFRQKFLKGSPVYGAPVGVNKYTADEDTEKYIYSLIKDICISMQSKDYLELPEKREINYKIEMPDKIAKKYYDFEKDKVLELIELIESMKGEAITAVNAAALTTKLTQYASGAIYDADKNSHEVHTLKISALLDILEDADGDPVLLFYKYNHDRERILKYCKKYKPRILKTEKDFNDWNENKLKLAMLHLQSGGHGLNLQRMTARKYVRVIFFTPEFNLDYVLQGIARVFRQGLKCKLIVYKLVLEGTIDERIVQSNVTKADGQSALMDYVRDKITEYQ